jgi:iron complex outermembrane receptor protein
LIRSAIALSVLLSLPAAPANTSQVPLQEEILVIGRKPDLGDGAGTLGFVSVTDVSQVAAPPQTIAELAISQPGVAYSGQGGLFQTLAIRGLSRDRVGSFYLDIPLSTERRAGTAASFVDPFMLQNLEIIRGPATSYYGSGNLGGAMALRPRQSAGMDVQVGWGSAGNENYQALGWGSDGIQAAFSHRGAGDSTSAAGAKLHTDFDQYNLMLGGQQQRGGLNITANTLLSYADDIGKSNNMRRQRPIGIKSFTLPDKI